VPEAEDVLLEAAELASHAVRRVWERHRDDGMRHQGQAATSAAQRRLAAWQTAWLGRSWAVAPADPRPTPGLVARWLRRIPRWLVDTDAAPFTDGQRIWLPRDWLATDEGGAPDGPDTTDATSERPLLATLGLARRLARGNVEAPTASAPPARGNVEPTEVSSAPARSGAESTAAQSPLARDVAWLAEGALGDVAIARAWPGLAPALDALRREVRRKRPSVDRMRLPERRLESWLEALLALAPERLSSELLGGLEPDSPATAIAAFATRLAGSFEASATGYRGSVPVVHWGVEHPVRPARTASGRARPASSAPPPSQGARLRRPLVRRAPEPEPDDERRQAPFVLPFTDPQLTVDDPGTVTRPPDQGDEEDVDTLAEELSRLESLPVVRDDTPVRETLEDGGASTSDPTRQADELESSAGDGFVWLYPEWDARRSAYRDPGCRVRELPASGDDGGWAKTALGARKALLTRLRRELEALRPRRQRLRRQPDGDELDVTAWVDDWADARAERAPAGLVYARDRPRRRDVAVTLLLDASGSTESWLSGSQRVIDVVKESALVFAEALAMLGDRFALMAFSGQGAADVRVRVLKRFDEPPGPNLQRRIGALEPDAFTRLGGALRHATAGLARERARAKLLLVLSDGRPQDEDGYEGRQGVEDVRQAVAEARMQGVRVFAVTIDRESASELPRLYGPGGYTVIWNAEALPDRLPAVYRRLTAGS
jgi:nitric oxide reductase NorD protein